MHSGPFRSFCSHRYQIVRHVICINLIIIFILLNIVRVFPHRRECVCVCVFSNRISHSLNLHNILFVCLSVRGGRRLTGPARPIFPPTIQSGGHDQGERERHTVAFELLEMIKNCCGEICFAHINCGRFCLSRDSNGDRNFSSTRHSALMTLLCAEIGWHAHAHNKKTLYSFRMNERGRFSLFFMGTGTLLSPIFICSGDGVRPRESDGRPSGQAASFCLCKIVKLLSAN